MHISSSDQAGCTGQALSQYFLMGCCSSSSFSKRTDTDSYHLGKSSTENMCLWTLEHQIDTVFRSHHDLWYLEIFLTDLHIHQDWATESNVTVFLTKTSQLWCWYCDSVAGMSICTLTNILRSSICNVDIVAKWIKASIWTSGTVVGLENDITSLKCSF